MKLITRDTDYAIRLLCCVVEKKKGQKFTAEEIVSCLKMPKPFLRKILQKLNHGGVLKSQKGRSGGFVLAKDPKKILVGDLIKIFQGPIYIHEHVFMKKICPNAASCLLKNRLDLIEKHVVNELNSITLHSLLR